MATIPHPRTLTNVTENVLNAIRNQASNTYRDYVPIATADAESIRQIGAVIMDYPELQNEFVSALINRIALVVVTSKTYQNPWAIFKRGVLDFGESIEEIFVDIAKVETYDPADAENTLYKRYLPNIRSAFHVLNYEKFYPVTISDAELRKAFTSYAGVSDLIARIVNSLYSALNYDEYQTMKYMLARKILSGMVTPVAISDVTAAKTVVKAVKGIVNKMRFMSPDYNIAHVKTFSDPAEQYILLDTQFDADMDVDVLATAFNMDKAEFIGRRVLIDGFGNLDANRLAELFANDPNYVALTSAEIAALNTIPCAIVDRDFFMIYDNLLQFREDYNGKGLYWNEFLHAWKTFSVSPFANAAVAVAGEPTVTAVALSAPTTAVAGSVAHVLATVTTTNFAPQTVEWSVSPSTCTVDAAGNVTIPAGFTGTITVTATSTYDSTKSATATITVA